jgi:hypothetical protein
MSRPFTMTLTLGNDHLSSPDGTFDQTIHNKSLGLNKPLCCLVPVNASHLWSKGQDVEGRWPLSLGWYATVSSQDPPTLGLLMDRPSVSGIGRVAFRRVAVWNPSPL